MNELMSCRALAVAVVAGCLVAPALAVPPKVDRPVLKGYFERGDRPTQAQFAALIDSSVNQFQFTAGAGGAHTIEGLEPGNGLLTGSGGLLRLHIGDTIPAAPTFSQTVTLASLVIDDRYLLGMRFMQDGLPHVGYLDVSVDSPLPGQDGYFGLTIHGWSYEDQPNTPITVTEIPAAPGALVLVAGAGAMAGRRRRSCVKRSTSV